MAVHACIPPPKKNQEVEAGGAEGQDQPWLQSKFKTSMDYMKYCQKDKQEDGKMAQVFKSVYWDLGLITSTPNTQQPL